MTLIQFCQQAIVVVLAAAFCTAAIMTEATLPSAYLPLVFAGTATICGLAFLKLEFSGLDTHFTKSEFGLIGYAAIIGIVRLIPYTWQYVDQGITAAVNDDDYWHFQELASLVNSDRFPPRLNFQMDSYLHFYYISLVPAAALSDIFKLISGQPLIKLSYGVDALFLGLAASFIFIIFIRHVLDESARTLSIFAVFLAGAAVEGLRALRSLFEPQPIDLEWWQTGLLIKNLFSMWTNLLVYVPHHLISAMAVLMAVVIGTYPKNLRLRKSCSAQIAAGLLLGFSLFSSIFAFLGGILTVLPLLQRSGTSRHYLFVIAIAFSIPSLPLAYIYLHANAANGFILFQPFVTWSTAFHSPIAGIIGIGVALFLMFIEVGWMFYVSIRNEPALLIRSPLGKLALAAIFFLLSTACISFVGPNNYAMRGAIVPSIILCCYWADVAATRANGASLGLLRLQAPYVVIAIFASIAQLHELAIHCRSSWRAISFGSETRACKQAIFEVNSGLVSYTTNAIQLKECLNPGSVYLIERPFEKQELLWPDREIMGSGP